MLRAAILLGAACLFIGGCGDPGPQPGALAGGVVPASPRAVSVGRGARFQPPAGAFVTATMRCVTTYTPRYGVHLELFADGHIIVVPAGIGFERPLRRAGAYVHGGRCSYPLRTREPTGVIEVAREAPASLGEFFAIWGRPLNARRLLDFQGRVRAWVDGRRITGDPRAIALVPHAQIVVVVGPDVPVHATYAFPATL